MNRIVFLIPALCVMLGACGFSGQKKYKKYTGIRYEDYETNQELITQGENTDIQQDDIQAPVFEQVEELDDDSVVESTNSAYGEAVVVMATKKISVGKNAATKDMQMLLLFSFFP